MAKRNIQLVSLTDPDYVIYLSQFKNIKEDDVVYDTPANKKSEVMSYLLEMVVGEWVKSSNNYHNDRIITYEYGYGETCNKIFKEVDYILKNEENYVLGEIKVSSLPNGMVDKACSQLAYSKELISHFAKSISMQIIRIDLNTNEPKALFDVFYDDFKESIFQDYVHEGIDFKLLHLSAKDVFNYGVKNKIIKSPELFSLVVYETELINLNRKIKSKLKSCINSLKGEIDHFEEEYILCSLNHFEKERFVINTKIKLSQEGWVCIQDLNTVDYFLILNSLGNNYNTEFYSGADCERTNGFCTEDQRARYISYFNHNDEFEIELLDAEKVYCRLSIEQGHALQKIEFTGQNIYKPELVTYPLFNKSTYRKFYYNGNFLNPEDMEDKSLLQFEQVIKKSEPSKIVLGVNDFLIFDNHRMLHRLNSSSTHEMQKKII